MSIKIGPGRDLRSVMQNVEQSRKAKNDSARMSGASNDLSELAVSGGKKTSNSMALTYEFKAGSADNSDRIYVDAAANAKKFGLDSVAKKTSLEPDLGLDNVGIQSSPTARGGGWQFIAPEDVADLSAMAPPFALSEELEPSTDPYAMVEAAANIVSHELRTQPGLATMVQANVSPSRAYQLLSNQ